MNKKLNVFLIAFIITSIDRLSKIFISKYLVYEQPVTLIPQILNFYKIDNPGAAFGILKGYTTFLTIFTVIAILGISIWILKYSAPLSKLSTLGTGFLIGGAAGNLIDRIVSTQVLDFIKLEFINFPVFNLADIFINLGAILIIIEIILNKKNNEQSE